MKAVLALTLLFAAQAHALQASVGDVKDSRTTGQFFAELEIQLKLVGDEMNDVEAVRTLITAAIDDTGRDLRKTETKQEFEDFGRQGFRKNEVSLKFKNPARKAQVVSQISGSIELFIPKNDPQARVVLTNILASHGKTLQHPALKGAGISLAAFTSEQYASYKQAELKKQSGDLSKSFSQLFSGSEENSLTFLVRDPLNNLVKLEVLDSAGTPLKNRGSMSSEATKTFYYESKPPGDAQLRVSLLSDRALVKVPLNLTNVALP